jgi:REP element-mobilizing transposase RayT
MIRGVNGCTIFRAASDYEDFLARFAFLVRELGFLVLAWCLLGNHAHIILKTGDAPLAKLMARLTGRHAQRFNRAEERFGHLFQDRYKALRIEDDARLASDAAYVLGNALRHGTVTPPRLGDYPFGGYGALVGRRVPRSFESIELMASVLGVERARAGGFVLERALAAENPGAALEPDQIDELNRLIRAVCRAHGVAPQALRGPTMESKQLREEVLMRAEPLLELSRKAIARQVGIPYRTACNVAAGLRGAEKPGNQTLRALG